MIRRCSPVAARRVVLALLSLTLALPTPAAPQVIDPDRPDWVADVGVAGANVLAGALTAGATAALRGESVPDAFWRGAVGGATVFAGKRVAVTGFGGSGLLGRQIGALGSSVVANAGADRGWLEEVWLPLGPVWVQASPRSDVRGRLDLYTVGATVWAVARPELRADWQRSIRSGAVVFRSSTHRITIDDGARAVGGFATGGLIALGVTGGDPEVLDAHEIVHVIQHDFLLHTMSRPVEALGWNRILGRRPPIDIGLLMPAGDVPVLGDLIEAEAEILSQ